MEGIAGMGHGHVQCTNYVCTCPCPYHAFPSYKAIKVAVGLGGGGIVF